MAVCSRIRALGKYYKANEDWETTIAVDRNDIEDDRHSAAFHALGYDTAYFVADAIGRASELTGEAVQQAMTETTDFSGVTGTFGIDPATHEPIKAALVIELKNGIPASATPAPK